MASLGTVDHDTNTTATKESSLSETDIQKFYDGTTVLVTGGTGFVGQLIIEKLLRSCPGVRKIYVLARPRKNKDISSRLRDQFKSDVYDKLREVNPKFEDKVETIAGDCGELGLGISNDEKSTLMDEVSVIFHCAATVRFYEPLRLATRINTRGAREMIALGKGCKNLKALVHVSTAYSNVSLPEVEERIYGVELPGEKLIDLVESMDSEALQRITPSLLNEHPNTYTYTKKAAEDIVRKYGQDLPCCVVRPSIISGTAQEPLMGWAGNLYGIGGVFVGVGMGIIHTLPIDESKIADIVPCDYVTNACIAAAWQTARLWRRNAAVDPRVYSCTTSKTAPLSWGRLVQLAISRQSVIPVSKALYAVKLVNSSSLYGFLAIFVHWIPAYIADFLLTLAGKKPQFKKLYTKMAQMVDSLSLFIRTTWLFHNDNTVQLFNNLSTQDQSIFNFDLTTLDWDNYFKTLIYGTRLYLLKDPVETIPQGKVRSTYLECVHYFVCALVVLIVYGVFRLLSLVFSLL